ncbi:MAG: dockerin type I domain-containing protein [Planctomycetota bacterium]|nr:dockerin type I domain-containing protein [Planctomycetota bacterium]
METIGMMLRIGVVGGVALAVCGEAMGQFDPPTESAVRERLQGEVIVGDEAPTPEAGDQIGVFFENQIIGRFTFTSANAESLAYEVLVFGDDPNTTPVEGPNAGARITFRFFDSSSNMIITEVRARNQQGETTNVNFAGDLVPMIPGLPIDLTPTREFDLVLGEGGDDGNGGEGPTGPRGDVNADGVIDRFDAALVLRIVTGATRGVTEDEASRADVNDDGIIDTRDAIAILTKRTPDVRAPGDGDDDDDEEESTP